MTRRRPWHAIATVSDPTSPTGARLAGRCAACTRGGLDAWIRERRAAGQSVAVWQVLALTEVTVTPAPDPEPVPVA